MTHTMHGYVQCKQQHTDAQQRWSSEAPPAGSSWHIADVHIPYMHLCSTHDPQALVIGLSRLVYWAIATYWHPHLSTAADVLLQQSPGTA